MGGRVPVQQSAGGERPPRRAEGGPPLWGRTVRGLCGIGGKAVAQRDRCDGPGGAPAEGRDPIGHRFAGAAMPPTPPEMYWRGGGGGFGWDPPSSQGPPVVDAEGAEAKFWLSASNIGRGGGGGLGDGMYGRSGTSLPHTPTTPNSRGTLILFGESGTLVPLLTSAASAP